MPYKDPEKQREAMRKITREYRARKKAELVALLAESRKHAATYSVGVHQLDADIECEPMTLDVVDHPSLRRKK